MTELDITSDEYDPRFCDICEQTKVACKRPIDY